MKKLIATSYRGEYVVNDGWVYCVADKSKGYGDCAVGDFEYFVGLLKKSNDYKITELGKHLLEQFNHCKKGVRCSYCHHHMIPKCDIYK